MMPRVSEIEGLEDTVRPAVVRRTRISRRKGRPAPATPPLIVQWKAEQADANLGWFKRWASSQVAGYRLELIIGYLTLMLFGGAAIAAGIPIFSFTTPLGFTPIWGGFIILGGFVSAVGALRAGEEPQTRVIRVFNRIELGGAVTLFLMLGTYTVLLLLIGNGAFAEQRADSLDTATEIANLGRVAVGCAMLALTSHPAVRMVWLIFRPGKIKPGPVTALVDAHRVTEVEDVDTGPTGIVK